MVRRPKRFQDLKVLMDKVNLIAWDDPLIEDFLEESGRKVKHAACTNMGSISALRFPGSTFTLVEFSRADVARVKHFVPADQKGVYVLINASTREAYVGQGGLLSRMGEHVKEKPFWTHALCLFSICAEENHSDLFLFLECFLIAHVHSEWMGHNKNKGHAGVLQGLAAGAARSAQQILVGWMNPNKPLYGWFNPRALSTSTGDEEGIIFDRSHLAPSTNVKLLVPYRTAQNSGQRFKFKTPTNGRVSGVMTPSGVWLEKGCKLGNLMPSFYSRHKALFTNLLAEGTIVEEAPGEFYLQRRKYFSSTSAAASFLQGSPASGPAYFARYMPSMEMAA